MALDRNLTDARICDLATAKEFNKKRWSTYSEAVEEAKRRGLDCSVTVLKLELNDLVVDKRKSKAFNKCMFKNIKPNSNAAQRRIVRAYCLDQAGY